MTAFGVYVRPAPCWTVVRRGGGSREDDAWLLSHYDTKADAQAALPGFATDGDLPVDRLVVEQETAVCTEAYAICGGRYVHGGDFDECHFADPASVVEVMRGDGLIEVGPGQWTCCDRKCEVCAEAIRKVAERLLCQVDINVDGQQSLFDEFPTNGDPDHDRPDA